MLAPDLRDETYAALRDHVLPTGAELDWRTIPWRRSLWEAVVDPVSRTRPILLWAMDGSPLGMTCGNGIQGRELIWTDPAVRALAARFVPAAADAAHLARETGPECDFFRRVAEQGHYAGVTLPTTTRQGIYALTAGGTLLASMNTLRPGDVADMLRTALARWEALSSEARRKVALPPARAAAEQLRSVAECEDGGLVLRVYARDLPRPDAHTREWNQDHLWLSAVEARALVPAGGPGAERRAPAALAERIARFHLVDDVRGQTVEFPPGAIEEAELRAEITHVDGENVALRLSGRMRAAEAGTWPVRGHEDREHPTPQTRGYDMALLGHARFDRRAGRFLELELVAAGPRWGATQYNRRGDDRAPGPLGIVFALCEDDRCVPAALEE